MKFYRVFSVVKRVFRDLKNDRRTPALMFIAPLFAMFVFGLAFSGDVKNVRVIVINTDEGVLTGNTMISLSEKIILNLDREVMDVEMMENADEAQKQIENGKAYAVIIFPKTFSNDVLKASPSAVQLLIDKSNVDVANAIMKSVNKAILDTMEGMGKEPLITIKEDPVYGENVKFMDYFFPGILSFVAYLLTILLTLISFVSERISGTLDRSLATSLRESEIVTGYAVTFGILGMVQSALLLTVGTVVFDIHIAGNVMVAFAVIALLAVVSQSLGILLSSLAKREVQAIQFFPFVVLPAFLLSGIFWPLEAIPSWLWPASYLVPLTYAVDACRAVMVRGWGLEKVWIDVVALMGFAVVFLVMAMWSLRRRG